MNVADDVVPFPLYHGTSSHYLSAFKPGCLPAEWPHKDDALRLLKDAWDASSLRRHLVPDDVRESLGWDVRYDKMPLLAKNIIEQSSRYTNWQHGELYLTASVPMAVSYGCHGARHGGELLTQCKVAIDVLSTVDLDRAKELRATAESLKELLQGTERPPLLVEFNEVRFDELSTEVAGQDVRQRLSLLTDETDELIRKVFGQQTNFRLAKGCGIVARVSEVRVADIDLHEVLDPYELIEISTFC